MKLCKQQGEEKRGGDHGQHPTPAAQIPVYHHLCYVLKLLHQVISPAGLSLMLPIMIHSNKALSPCANQVTVSVTVTVSVSHMTLIYSHILLDIKRDRAMI